MNKLKQWDVISYESETKMGTVWAETQADALRIAQSRYREPVYVQRAEREHSWPVVQS